MLSERERESIRAINSPTFIINQVGTDAYIGVLIDSVIASVPLAQTIPVMRCSST